MTNQTPLADLEAQAATMRRDLLAKLRTRTAAKSSKMRAILRGEIDALADEIRQIDAQVQAAELAAVLDWLHGDGPEPAHPVELVSMDPCRLGRPKRATVKP